MKKKDEETLPNNNVSREVWLDVGETTERPSDDIQDSGRDDEKEAGEG
jgi:hypothetical protein